MVPWDIITNKGQKAQDLGGHNQYKLWEKIENDNIKREQNKINWPQKNWWIILILSAIIFPLITGLILEGRKKVIEQSPPNIQIIHDTIYIQRVDKNQDTLNFSTQLHDTNKK